MIKNLKVSDKVVRKFKSNKSWKYSTINSLGGISLEQTNLDGDRIPLVLNEAQSLATEQNANNTKVKIRRGKRIDGTFYPHNHIFYDETKEPINIDGTYYRNVYNSVKHLFYNNYGIYENETDVKNPLMVFGSETGQYKVDDSESDAFGNIKDKYERRIIKDDILVIEFSKNQFGEKIKPNNFRITDYSSPYGVIEIVDDGSTNLVISGNSFNEIKKITRSNSDRLNFKYTDENFNSSDMSVGSVMASDGDYVLSGAPMYQDSPSDYLTGTASLFRYDENTKEFRSVREFKCPFTQQGLIEESELNSSGFLVTELGKILGGKNYSINDEFGSAVELKNGTCAIGSPRSHIHGDCNESRQGHVFLYDIDKGGSENWGMTNILEGDPGSLFGSSISIYGNFMAIGAPGMYNDEGAIYIFEKKLRDENTPWYRINDSYSGYCFNDIENIYKGYPVCDKLKELNENTHRWKITNASPSEYELTYFGSEPDECEENTISKFDSEEDIASFGFETNFPIPEYHEFQNGNKTPKYGIGDVTWELVSIVRASGSQKLGQKVKLFGDVLLSTTPDTDDKKAYLFRKRPSETGSCDIWKHIQSFYKNEIYNYDSSKLILSQDYFNKIKYEVNDDSITIEVETKQVAESTGKGFIYRIDKLFGEGTDKYNSRILHNGNVIDSSNKFTIKFDDIDAGDHNIYIGRYLGSFLVGTPSVISFSINPKIVNVESRKDMVKYPYKYFENKYSNFGTSLETNGKYIFIGDSNDRKYVDTDVELTQGISFSAGSVWMYKIEDNTLNYIRKIYEDDDVERRYNNKFGCDVSLIGNDLLIGSPCTDQSRIQILNEGKEFKIPDYKLGVENNSEEFYTVVQSLFTSFEYEYLGLNQVDMMICIDTKSITDIDLETISDFEIRASFIYSEKNYIDTDGNGTLTRGVYRDKTKFENSKICFFVKTIGHLFDPTEEIEFIYNIKRNSIQGCAKYYRIDDADNLYTIKEIVSVKEKNNVKTQYGESVSLSSTRIYVGNPVLGDWPIDQISSFGDDNIVSFDNCSHVFSQRGDIIWGNLEHNELQVEGSVISYDVKTIRDGDRVYVGNVFYKNGIAVITELTEYFSNMLSLGGRRGYEISFDGINSIYENEVVCKVNPHEFNVSTNPSSVEIEDIDFDVTDDGKFDIVDLSYIYRYILGSFKRVSETEDTSAEVDNSLVLEQDAKWPNDDVIISEADDVIIMNILNNLTVNNNNSKEEDLKILDRLDALRLLGMNGLDIDGDGVVGASDAKLLARYFVGRTGKALTDGLVSPFYRNIKRPNAYQIIEYLDQKTGKYNGRKILNNFLDYEEKNKQDKKGSYLAPYATTVGLYDGPDLVMTAKLAKPVKIIPNYPINFLIKYDV